ncbi:hypothetical protein FOG51_00374 [Hanseniaspora uvarum]|nr:hypothetical protein FOG48_00148 [Hanseniaspora uvarum]KAF0274742.1 hypothetical protein FOG51_00374 [Hanseniaspora uvarum]
MDAGMSSFKNPNGSNQNLSRRFQNNHSNLEFSPMDSYENPQASRGNTMASYNQQASRGNTMTSYNQQASRGNTMTSYNQQAYMNQQQSFNNNYNQQQYQRSNTMQIPPSAMNNSYGNQPSQNKGHGFSSIFKKKNESKNNNFEKEDDDDVMMGGNENIVSFNDISGFRKAGGPAYGFNNSSDTAPIIPTVLTTGTNIDPSKMNNTAYRKMLTNQKKSALSQYNKQYKDDSGTSRAMSMQSNQPPRAMTFQNGQQFRPPQGIPGPPPFGSKNGTPYGSRSNSMLNGMRQPQFQQNQMYPQNQFPNKAMTMAQGNKAPFMQQQKMGNPNYRANSMQMRNMPPQDANFGNANKQINNGSYLQQQQQLYGGMQQSPQVYQPQSGTMQKSPYVSQEQIPMQKNQFALKEQQFPTQQSQSEPVPQENVPQLKEYNDFNAAPKKSAESLPNHKKSESIKLRPNSALFKGLENENEELHEDFRPIKHENSVLETPKHAHKGSIISFNSPIPDNSLVKKNREFYQMGKNVNTTGDFVTAQELPVNEEFEFGNKQNDTTQSDSASIKSKTKNFFKRMSGLSSHSRNNSSMFDQAHDFKVHSVVKTSDDIASENEKKLIMAARNRNDYTFKASKTSFAEMTKGNTGYNNQNDNYDRRQSYHSLFSNEDLNYSNNKPSAIQEEEPEVHENVTNDTVYDEENLEDRKSPNDVNSSIYDQEETKQNVSLKSPSQESKYQIPTKEPEPSAIPTNITIEKDNEMHQKLMKEIFILSEELTESIVRETDLERKLMNSRVISTSVTSSPTKNSGAGTLNSATTPIGLLDVQLELRKKSKNIVQLIKDLNEERMKRFIAEEEVLNIKNGCKPDFLELSYKYKKMESELAEKNEIISSLREKLESGL